MFWGPGLAGVTEFARHLSWADRCQWQVPQDMPGRPRGEWGSIGSALVDWHGRQLLVDLGYRGPLWTPPLGSSEWQEYEGRGWSRFQEVLEQSLRRASGVVFVADSQEARAMANSESLERLRRSFIHVGRDPRDVAVVFALNKRDLVSSADTRLLPVAELKAALTWPDCDYVETSAAQGVGVEQVIARVLELIENN